MADQPAHMWRYWRDKKGYESALTEYFPRTLRQTEDLRTALLQIRAATALIDQIMREQEDTEEGLDL